MTKYQAIDVYKMIDMDKVINIETMKQEIEDNKMRRNRLKEDDNTEGNLYQMAIQIKYLEMKLRHNK